MTSDNRGLDCCLGTFTPENHFFVIFFSYLDTTVALSGLVLFLEVIIALSWSGSFLCSFSPSPAAAVSTEEEQQLFSTGFLEAVCPVIASH